MKKALIALLPASLLLLAACGGGGSSSSLPSDSLNDSSSSSEQEGSWTADEITLMKNHLGDNVLPYIDLGTYAVSWDETFSCITVLGEGDATTLASYNTIATAADYACEYDSDKGIYEGALELLEGQSIDLMFYLYEGKVEIDAYLIVPLAAWPAEQIAAFLDATTETVPAYGNGAYYFFDDLSYDYGVAQVRVLDSDAYDVTFYENVLKLASWVNDDTSLATDGYFTSVSPKGTIALTCGLDGDVLYVQIAPQIPLTDLSVWPSDAIAAFLGEGATAVPSFAAAAYGVYQFDGNDTYAAYYYVEIEAENVATTETIYQAAFPTDVWTIDATSEYDNYGIMATDKAETVEVDFKFDSDSSAFGIWIYRYGDIYA